MRDGSHDKPAACDCCAEAERNPLSGLYRSDCRACLVRRLARAPRSERERVYAATAPDALGQLVADVRAAWGLRGVSLRPTEEA